MASYGYTDRPAIIHIDKNKQLDTNGFNMGSELIEAVYQLVLQEKVKLYLSPRKEDVISIATMRGIEESNGLNFDRIKDIFFHEYWTSNRKKTSFTIVGISFVGKTNGGESVSFGYLDLKEAWPYLSTMQVHMNENGNFGMNITEAMYSRRYSFNLVQLGHKDFKNKPEKSIKCKKYAFNGSKELKALTPYKNDKKVKYLIEQRTSETTEIGHIIYANLESFLNTNKEVLLNIGGAKYFDYKGLKSEVAITRLEVIERYSKFPKGGLNTQVVELLIYVNNKPLNPVALNTVLGWGIIFNFNSIEDILREKKFKYTLLQLNSVLIPEYESDWYLAGLQSYNWSRLSHYVESYRKKE